MKKRSGEAPLAPAPVSTSYGGNTNASNTSGGHNPVGALFSYASSHNYQDVNVEDSGDINYDTRGKSTLNDL